MFSGEASPTIPTDCGFVRPSAPSLTPFFPAISFFKSSGGLGVGGSNPLAPTGSAKRKARGTFRISGVRISERRAARTGAESSRDQTRSNKSSNSRSRRRKGDSFESQGDRRIGACLRSGSPSPKSLASSSSRGDGCFVASEVRSFERSAQSVEGFGFAGIGSTRSSQHAKLAMSPHHPSPRRSCNRLDSDALVAHLRRERERRACALHRECRAPHHRHHDRRRHQARHRLHRVGSVHRGAAAELNDAAATQLVPDT